MSDRTPAALPPHPPRPARWLDRLSVALVCVGVLGAAAAAAPSILRATGVDVPAVATVSAPSAAPSATAAAPRPTNYAVDENPRFVPEGDEPRITELERLYPDGMWPGQGSRERRELAAPSTKARKGHAGAPLTVREKPDAASPLTGHVPAGETLLVIRELGDWTLVVHQGADGTTIGWAPRGLVAVP
jgi:hypothetical protein